MQHGKIGKIVLKVPWKSLGSSPTVVQVSDVLLCVGFEDISMKEFDAEAAAKAAIEAKLGTVCACVAALAYRCVVAHAP